MPDQDGLRFLFDIQDKITAKLAKITARVKASATKIDSALTKTSKAQEANASKIIHREKLRGIAVESAAAKATAARTKETKQGAILAQRLSAAQASEARKAENFRIAAAKRTAAAIVKAERAAANAGKKTSRTFQTFSQATFAGMVSAAGAIALARKAWTAFTGLIRSSFSLWGEQEQSVAAMTTALKAQGSYTPALAKQYQDLASELQGLSTDGDETLLKMQALLIQVGDVGPDQMKQALTAAQDLAVGLDTDLKTAALLVGKAFAGDTTTLKRYGIVLDQTELKQRGVAVVLEAIQAKFGGQAAAKAQTFAGVIEQLGNSWGDLKEKIGEWLTQSSGMLTPMLAKVTDAVAWLNTNFDSLKPVFKAVAALIGVTLVAGLGALGVVIYTTVVPAIVAMNAALLANPVGLVVIAIAALVGGLYLLYTNSETVRVVFDAMANIAKKVFAVAIDLATKAITWLWKWAIKAKDAIVGMIPKWVSKAAEWLGKKVAVVTGKLRDYNESLEETTDELGKTAKSTEKLAEEQAKAAKSAKKLAKAEAKLSKEQAEAAKVAKKSAEAVQGLVDGWTGATLKSGEFLRAVKKLTPAQRDNDRIMKQVIQKYESMRKILDPFDDDLEDLWKTTKRLTKEKKAEEKAQKAATKAQKDGKKAAEDLNERLWDQRLRLLGLPTKKAIRDFEELTITWDLLSEEEKGVATPEFAKRLLAAEDAGNKLDAAQIALIASTGHLTKEQEKLKKESEDLNGRLEKQRKRLLGLPTESAIQAFEELTQTWEGLNEAEKAVATKAYSAALRDAAAAGHELNAAQIELGNSAGAAWVDSFFGTLSKAFEGGGGFMGGLKSLASNAFGQIFSSLGGGKGGGFTDALGKMFSGEGVMGKLGGIAGKLGGKIGKFMSIGLNGIPIVGPLLATFGPALLKGLGKLGKKIWGWAKKLFGGVSAAEKAGRKTAHEFRQGVIAGLTEAQRIEVQLSWDEGWDSSVIIAVRDALVATGMDFDAARAAADRWYQDLWKAEKEGPKAVERVQAAIQAILDAATAGTKDAVDEVATALEAIDALRLAAIEAAEARQEAELASIDAQIEAVESRLRPKISELEALISQQEAELAALSTRQESEMEALASRRQAALDSIMALQEEQLSMLKETQRRELDEMKAAQEAELSVIKAARAASLGVIESAIQRELEDERIAAQLKIDLRKAGGDQEAIDAAHARAQTSTERLLERDELDALMVEAEERVRARYQDELDTVTAHWDALESLTVVKHQEQLTELEGSHAMELTALETSHALELQAHNEFWDTLNQFIALQHALELTALEAAHTAQLEALLASLQERRVVLLDAHAAELAAIESRWAAEKQAVEDGIAAIDAVPGPADKTHTVTTTFVNNGTTTADDLDHRTAGMRRHGGPVRAGRRYLVGEGGPEMFVPSQSGRIASNGSSGGGVDAKAVGRAVAAALEGTEINVDGRKLGRLTVRHQPLAMAELGGRR